MIDRLLGSGWLSEKNWLEYNQDYLLMENVFQRLVPSLVKNKDQEEVFEQEMVELRNVLALEILFIIDCDLKKVRESLFPIGFLKKSFEFEMTEIRRNFFLNTDLNFLMSLRKELINQIPKKKFGYRIRNSKKDPSCFRELYLCPRLVERGVI